MNFFINQQLLTLSNTKHAFRYSMGKCLDLNVAKRLQIICCKVLLKVCHTAMTLWYRENILSVQSNILYITDIPSSYVELSMPSQITQRSTPNAYLHARPGSTHPLPPRHMLMPNYSSLSHIMARRFTGSPCIIYWLRHTEYCMPKGLSVWLRLLDLVVFAWDNIGAACKVIWRMILNFLL